MIELGEIKEKDLEKILKWRNSEYVMPYCREFKPLTMENQQNWFKSLINDDKTVMFSINAVDLPKEIEHIIGVCGLVRINWHWRIAEISFYIGNSNFVVGNVIKDALEKLIDYAFNVANLRKLYWPIYEFNPHLETYKKFMDVEYIAKSEYPYKGKYWDRIVLTKFRNEN